MKPLRILLTLRIQKTLTLALIHTYTYLRVSMCLGYIRNLNENTKLSTFSKSN